MISKSMEQYIWNQKGFRKAAYCLIISVCLSTGLRWFSGYVIDLINDNNLYILLPITLIMAILYIIFKSRSTKLLSASKNQMERDLWNKLLHKQLYLSSDLEQALNTGMLVTIFTNDIRKLIQFSIRFISRVIPDILSFVLANLILISFHPSLSVVAMVSVIGTYFLQKTSVKKIQIANEKYQKQLDKMNELHSNSLYNLELVKCYQLTERCLKNSCEGMVGLQKNKNNLLKYESLISIPFLFSAFLTMFMILLSGAVLYINNRLSIGQFFTSITLLDFIVNPIMNIDRTVAIKKTAIVSHQRVKSFMDMEEEIVSKQIDTTNNKDIILCNLGFSYGTSKVFNSINHVFQSGKINYIVGENGKGKSTLIKLLTGIYLATNGTIQFMGDIITQENKGSLTKFTSTMTQDLVFYSTTIQKNITALAPTVEMEKVINLCKQMGIHDEIAHLPKAYETVLAEDGKPLSRGQRQRLAFVRTVLKPAKVYIFDEPMSALDGTNANLIIHTLQQLALESIVIVITHRDIVEDVNENILQLV